MVLMGFTCLLYIGSTFYFSDLILHPLEYRYRPSPKIQGDVIVILGGGATLDTPNSHFKGHLSGAAANRLLTGIQLYQQLKVPLIFSGGKVYENTGREADIAKAILEDAGIPHRFVLAENQSLTTTENARYTKKVLAEHHFQHPVLVTSAFHMARSVKQFQKAGIGVSPYPTDYRTNEKPIIIAADFIPSADALSNFSLALKEYYGLLAVKWL